MARHADSELKKKATLSEKKDTATKAAIAEYELELKKPKKQRRSASVIARAHGVSQTTVTRHAQDPEMQTVADRNDSKNKLSHSSRLILVKWLEACADRGLPLVRRVLKEKVAELLRAEGKEDHTVTDNWIDRFLASPMSHNIATHWSSVLTKDRASASNPKAIEGWFNAWKMHVIDRGILPRNIYTMDQVNFLPGVSRKVRVIGRRGMKNTYRLSGGERASLTVMAPVCADSTYPPSTVIFKGKRMLKKWRDNNPLPAHVCCARRGYTNNLLGRSWIERFDNDTSNKNPGAERVLVFDVHRTHYSLALLNHAIANNISILGYTPKTTAHCQPQDVGLFAPLKLSYNYFLIEWEKTHKRSASVENFLEIYASAHLATFTEKNILAAFEKAGLLPFNPAAIAQSALEPSKELSIYGGFPVDPPSPVKEIIQAFRDAHHASSPLNEGSLSITDSQAPSYHTPAELREGVKRTFESLQHSDYAFLTPRHGPFSLSLQVPPPTVLHIPSPPMPTIPEEGASRTLKEKDEEIRALRECLQATEHQIAEDREVVESQNAQMVMQGLYNDELRAKLYSEESKRSRGKADALLHTNAPEGHIWTGPEFFAAVEEDDERLREQERLKADKKKVRESKADSLVPFGVAQ